VPDRDRAIKHANSDIRITIGPGHHLGQPGQQRPSAAAAPVNPPTQPTTYHPRTSVNTPSADPPTGMRNLRLRFCVKPA
jgi:hypothetical protein